MKAMSEGGVAWQTDAGTKLARLEPGSGKSNCVCCSEFWVYTCTFIYIYICMYIVHMFMYCFILLLFVCPLLVVSTPQKVKHGSGWGLCHSIWRVMRVAAGLSGHMSIRGQGFAASGCTKLRLFRLNSNRTRCIRMRA